VALIRQFEQSPAKGEGIGRYVNIMGRAEPRLETGMNAGGPSWIGTSDQWIMDYELVVETLSL